MKFAIIFAVLLAIVLQEASGAICKTKCKKRVRTGCRYRYYRSYSYYYGYRYQRYWSCSHYKTIDSLCDQWCTHGGWSNWSDFELYEDCPVLCGGAKGLAVRTRECNNPAPYNGGNNCLGDSLEERNITCNTVSCDKFCPEKTSKHLKHKEVAASFYQCDPNHKKAFLKECPQGTVFSEDTQTCVHSTTSHGSCSNNQKIPDPEDCGKYLLCNHGEYLSMPCTPGLQFNAIAQVCDWPANVQCETEPQ